MGHLARNTRLLAALVAALLVAAGAVGSASGVAYPSDAQLVEHFDVSSFTESNVPGPPGGSQLRAATALFPSTVWTVGSVVRTVSGNLAWHPIAERWNGSAWQNFVLPTPNRRKPSELAGVAAYSASRVWGVGSASVGALIERWDGQSWKIVPNRTTVGSSLAGVAVVQGGTAWAVGSTPVNGRLRTLIEHWNGSVWSPVASPHPGGPLGYDELRAVFARSPHDVWAVGDYETGGHFHTLVLHWGGSHWTRVPSPSPGYFHGNRLTGVVAISPTDVWAVGAYDVKQFDDRPLTEHWDGSSWHRVPAPSPNGSSYASLNAVTAISSTSVLAVGFGSGPDTLAEYWNGSVWSVVPTADRPGNPDRLFGITVVSPSDIWAVGSSNAP